MIPMLATPDTPAPTLPVQYSCANRSDVVGEYVAAKRLRPPGPYRLDEITASLRATYGAAA
jgi:hypothetical protein